jgi:hypothetical protein
MLTRTGVRVLLSALVVAVAATPGFTQGLESAGVKAGVNFARIDASDPAFDDLGTKIGLAVGAFVELGVNDVFSVQPEVLFSQKGAKGTLMFDEAVDVTFTADYVEIPILMKFTFGSGRVRPFVFTGPVPALNTGAKVRFEALGEAQEEDLSEDVKTADFGWAFGGGFKAGGFSVDARYTLGLTNFNEPTFDDADDDIKNHAFSVLAGFGWSRSR